MEVQWFGTDSRTVATGESSSKLSLRKQPSAKDLEELKEAGFNSIAAQAGPADSWTALRRVSHPMTIAEANVYRFWFKQRVKTEDYNGELPPGIVKRLIALKKAEYFAAFGIWIAKNGEAMLVGLLQAYRGKEPQTCIIGRWNASGPLTSFEVMQQAYKRRERLIWAGLVSIFALAFAALMTLLLLLPDGERGASRSDDNDMFPYWFPLFPLVIAVYMMNSSSKKRRANPAYPHSALNDPDNITKSDTSDGR